MTAQYVKNLNVEVLSLLFALPGQNILSPTFFLTYKSSLFLLIYSILLPLESKPCALTPTSALAFADSVGELRF